MQQVGTLFAYAVWLRNRDMKVEQVSMPWPEVPLWLVTAVEVQTRHQALTLEVPEKLLPVFRTRRITEPTSQSDQALAFLAFCHPQYGVRRVWCIPPSGRTSRSRGFTTAPPWHAPELYPNE